VLFYDLQLCILLSNLIGVVLSHQSDLLVQLFYFLIFARDQLLQLLLLFLVAEVGFFFVSGLSQQFR
jgi:hypothetical protein